MRSFGLPALLLALSTLTARAETIEAYIRPNDGFSVCFLPIPYEIYDPCTGKWGNAWPVPGVNLSVNPCSPFLLSGSWFMDELGCRAFRVQSITPTSQQCLPVPVLRAKAWSNDLYHLFEWEAPPCVGSYDVVSARAPVTTPLDLDQFQCALDDLESAAFLVGTDHSDTGMLTTMMVRGQQGPLATDHYGPASSGELRYLSNDCDVDLTASAPPP